MLSHQLGMICLLSCLCPSYIWDNLLYLIDSPRRCFHAASSRLLLSRWISSLHFLFRLLEKRSLFFLLLRFRLSPYCVVLTFTHDEVPSPIHLLLVWSFIPHLATPVTLGDKLFLADL